MSNLEPCIKATAATGTQKNYNKTYHGAIRHLALGSTQLSVHEVDPMFIAKALSNINFKEKMKSNTIK